MLDTPCCEVVRRVVATHSIRQFPFHSPSRASPCAITFQLESTKTHVHFHCLGLTKVSVEVRGFLCELFVTCYVFMVRSCQHLAQPQAKGPPLVGCPRLLIQYIRSNPPHWRSFPHPQPDEAPYRADRGPRIVEQQNTKTVKFNSLNSGLCLN